MTKLLVSTSLFLLVSTPIASPQADSIYAFSPDVKITEAGQYEGSSFGFFSSGQHFTAFRGDTVYVIWQESRDFTYIFFARSNDGGQTFGPNVVAAGGVNPSMRVGSAGMIYLAYQNGGDIFLRKSTDGGASFTARVKVNDDTIPQVGQETPAIAVNNKGQIFIAWIDRRLYPQSIFATASYDGGNTFTANVQASDSGFYAYSCDIAADDSGRVYVVWPEFVTVANLPLRVARSNDSGQSFAYRTTVSDLPVDPSQVYALWPSAAIGEGGVLGVA